MATQYPESGKKMRDSRQTGGQGTAQGTDGEDLLSRLTAKAGNFDENLQHLIASKPLVALATAVGFGFAATMIFKRLNEQPEHGRASGNRGKRKFPQGVH